MKRLTGTAFLVALTVLVGCSAESVSTESVSTESVSMETARADELPATAAAAQATTLVGQLLLPGEGGRRGVELHAWAASPGGEEHQIWVLPDIDGRFAREFSGVLTRVSVSAGSEVHRIDAADLPRADDGGRVDLGAIDLRKDVGAHRIRIRTSEGSIDGVVRVGLWIGPPHTGPRGELPSLGSKQFPPVALDSDIEWLLPPNASALYFLVERPDGPGRATNWRSGKQQLFGPYESSAFPLELILD